MAQTKINASQVDISASDIDAVQQVSVMPAASAGNVGNIVQFTGTTDATYTNGYFYKCVSDGENPATYSWTQTNVQPAGGGGGSVDSVNGQTGVVVLAADDVNAVPQVSTLPTPSSTNLGKIVEYVGEDDVDAGLLNGVFYVCEEVHGNTPTLTVAQTVGNSLSNLAVNESVFMAVAKPAGNMVVAFSTSANNAGTSQYDWAGGVLPSTYGVTYEGSILRGDTITVTYSIGAVTGYKWVQKKIEDKHVVNQVAEVPNGADYTDGKVLQYVGEDSGSFVKGQFYKNTKTYGVGLTATQTVGTGLSLGFYSVTSFQSYNGWTLSDGDTRSMRYSSSPICGARSTTGSSVVSCSFSDYKNFYQTMIVPAGAAAWDDNGPNYADFAYDGTHEVWNLTNYGATSIQVDNATFQSYGINISDYSDGDRIEFLAYENGGWICVEDGAPMSWMYYMSIGGTPTTGDELEITYHSHMLTGTSWESQRVQAAESVSIPWVAELNKTVSNSYDSIIATFGPGALPDGYYEFYLWVAHGNTNGPAYFSGLPTVGCCYKFVVNMFARSTYGDPSANGVITPVFDGNWDLNDKEYEWTQSKEFDSGTFFYLLDDNGIMFWPHEKPFSVDVSGTSSFPVFKISAFKNLSTGDSYIPSVQTWNEYHQEHGTNPPYETPLSGILHCSDSLRLPNYSAENTYNISYGNSVFVRIDGVQLTSLRNTFGNNCSNVDIYVTDNATGAQVSLGIDFHAKLKIGPRGYVYEKIKDFGDAYVDLVSPSSEDALWLRVRPKSTLSGMTSFKLRVTADILAEDSLSLGASYSTQPNMFPLMETTVGSEVNENNLGEIVVYSGQDHLDGSLWKACGERNFVEGNTYTAYYKFSGNSSFEISDPFDYIYPTYISSTGRTEAIVAIDPNDDTVLYFCDYADISGAYNSVSISTLESHGVGVTLSDPYNETTFYKAYRPRNHYEVKNPGWECVGGGVALKTLPERCLYYKDRVVQYVGPTTNDYVFGNFYTNTYQRTEDVVSASSSAVLFDFYESVFLAQAQPTQSIIYVFGCTSVSSSFIWKSSQYYVEDSSGRSATIAIVDQSLLDSYIVDTVYQSGYSMGDFWFFRLTPYSSWSSPTPQWTLRVYLKNGNYIGNIRATIADIETTYGIEIVESGGHPTQTTSTEVKMYLDYGAMTSWSLTASTVQLIRYGIELQSLPQVGDTILVSFVKGTESGGWEQVPFIQYSTMPSAASIPEGTLIQYIGVTDVNYTFGYFYKSVASYTPSSASISQTTGSGLTDLSVNVSTFESAEQPSGDETVNFVYNDDTPTFSYTWEYYGEGTQPITMSGDLVPFLVANGWSQADIVSRGSMFVYIYDIGDNTLIVQDSDDLFEPIETSYTDLGQYITIVGTFAGDDEYDVTINVSGGVAGWYLRGNAVSMPLYGISYTGTPVNGDVLTVAYTMAGTTGTWQQVNVQPDMTTVLTSVAGYDATKTQVLKNIQGVFTWVDES